ncbi:MAG TPA: SDR family NAD(P)-dependent oxidoreductase, partial [Blastococcus sp.]
MYADFVPFFASPEDGRAVIAAPAGDGRTSFVSRDDLADVGAAVLLDDSGRFDGQALDVTGPEALTMADAARVLTEVTAVPTEYRPQTVEEAWATRRPSGHPDWEIEGWVTSYLAIAAGELATVTDVVPSLTGHPALTVAEHLRRHPGDWAHLR